MFWGPLVGAFLVALSRLNKDIYRFLLTDDGPVEWLQVAFFVLALVMGIGIVIRAIRANRYDQATLFFVFALTMLFISGEEVSWGQRIIGWETPPELAEINKQNETTLHNIGEALSVINFGMMIIGLVGSVAYVLNRWVRIERYWQQANWFLIPPFFLSSAFFVLFLYKFIRFAFLPESAFTITKYSEWAELCLAFGLCVFAVLNFRRLGNQRETVTRVPSVTMETF